MANERPISLKTKEYRKVVKPLLERRRRARINGCLNELRNFILEATKQENSQASKLEKADILEMTVHYLKLLLRQQCVTTPRANVTELGRFKAGYTECANEVSSCVSVMSNVNPHVRNRLLSHLSKCLNQMDSMNVTLSTAEFHHQQLNNNNNMNSVPPTPSPSAHLSPVTPNSASHFPHFAPDQQQQQRWMIGEQQAVLRQHGHPVAVQPTDWPSFNVTVSPAPTSSMVWRPW